MNPKPALAAVPDAVWTDDSPVLTSQVFTATDTDTLTLTMLDAGLVFELDRGTEEGEEVIARMSAGSHGCSVEGRRSSLEDVSLRPTF